jgi:PIN domain nuclease of toxin-antitoxin system
MSQMIVLDTHIWFWLATQDWKRFPAAWREEIETAERVGVSPISCYEIVLAQERGRLELPCAFRDALEPILPWWKIFSTSNHRINRSRSDYFFV